MSKILQYLGILATLSIATIAVINYLLGPSNALIPRVNAIETLDATVQLRLDQHEQTFLDLKAADARIEKKVDAILIKNGLNPDSVLNTVSINK